MPTCADEIWCFQPWPSEISKNNAELKTTHLLCGLQFDELSNEVDMLRDEYGLPGWAVITLPSKSLKQPIAHCRTHADSHVQEFQSTLPWELLGRSNRKAQKVNGTFKTQKKTNQFNHWVSFSPSGMLSGLCTSLGILVESARTSDLRGKVRHYNLGL